MRIFLPYDIVLKMSIEHPGEGRGGNTAGGRQGVRAGLCQVVSGRLNGEEERRAEPWGPLKFGGWGRKRTQPRGQRKGLSDAGGNPKGHGSCQESGRTRTEDPPVDLVPQSSLD